jgi:uncharacterized protein YlxP (DUF503 family)
MPENRSLKDKRQVVRSLCQRIRNKFEVAVAEVADNDTWQLATIGVTCVSNSAELCDRMLRDIVAYAEESRLDAEVVDIEMDVIAF